MSDDPSQKNLWRKIEAKVKPIYIVAFFLLLFVWGLAQETKADVVVEVGPTFLSGEFSEGGALLLTEQFGKYNVGIGYISEQWVTPRREPRTFVLENVLVQAVRDVQITRKFQLGLGVAYFNGTNRALSSNFEFALRATYQLTPRLSLNFRHWSNAGSSRPNMGQDAFTVGYRFGL